MHSTYSILFKHLLGMRTRCADGVILRYPPRGRARGSGRGVRSAAGLFTNPTFTALFTRRARAAGRATGYSL